jgi:hypothetical protein
MTIEAGCRFYNVAADPLSPDKSDSSDFFTIIKYQMNSLL